MKGDNDWENTLVKCTKTGIAVKHIHFTFTPLIFVAAAFALYTLSTVSTDKTFSTDVCKSN